MPSPLSPSPNWFHALVHGVGRVLMLAVGAVLGVLALAFALVLAGVLLVWALLRGRRPVQTFRWPGRPGRTPPANGTDVVDIEAREVRDPPER